MGIIAFDVKQTREYVSPRDTGEDKTVFLLGVLDSRLYFYLKDRSRSFGVNTAGDDAPATVNLDIAAHRYRVVKYGLRGWQNLKDADGNDVPFKTRIDSLANVGPRSAVADECLDAIKPLIPELAREILRDNGLTEEDERDF